MLPNRAAALRFNWLQSLSIGNINPVLNNVFISEADSNFQKTLWDHLPMPSRLKIVTGVYSNNQSVTQ